MGKLKFTLSNLWLWTALIGVSFLTENLPVLTSRMNVGHTMASAFVLMLSAIICLVMYFIINHKENKMKFDYVALSICVILGIGMLIAIWMQGDMELVDDFGQDVSVHFTVQDKVISSISLILFLALMYGFSFMMTRTQPHSRWSLIVGYIVIIFVYVTIIFSLIKEQASYKMLFEEESTKPYIPTESFFGNKNYYGGIIFIGILTCMIVNYHRPRFIWYLTIVFFMIMLFCTACALCSIISFVAIPFYLLFDIIRFATKKKPVKTIYVTITFLGLAAFGALLYVGYTHQWNGFVKICEFFGKIMTGKDFSTFTNRTKIWETLLPLCFDNGIHTLFGHGFGEITLRLIQGITAACIGFNCGVRSAHNGYLQVLFEFGAVGLLVHVFIICVFIYSLIRLCMEKRFYFAYIYGFVGLCLAVYNFAESSPIFGKGIKEIYMTFFFILPVISRARLVSRKHFVNECKELPVGSGNMNPIALGKGLSGIFICFFAVIIPLLFVNFTLGNELVKTILLLALAVDVILLLTIPYLVSLYYRNTDKSIFVLHCVLNSVLLILICTPIGVLSISRGKLDFALWCIPVMVVLYLVLQCMFYSIAKKGSIKEWVQITFVGGFGYHGFAFIAAFLVGVGLYVTLEKIGAMNWFIYLFSLLVPICVYYAVLYFLPFKGLKEVLAEYNNVSLLHNKKAVIKDESYYG